MPWKSNSIRSITVDADNLSDFMGRNPHTVFQEEDLIQSIQQAIRSDRGVFFREGDTTYRLSPGDDEGTYRFSPAGNAHVGPRNKNLQ
ncbi:MAG: hypothetical protein SX243_24360 [Acidobacteriota bacterium]|nr:hypothetical protein [Acidobacteriota bacterium]